MGKVVTVAKSETAIGLFHRRSVSRVYPDPQIHRRILVFIVAWDISAILAGRSSSIVSWLSVTRCRTYSHVIADGISARTHRSNRTIIKTRDLGCVMRSHLSLN